MSCARAVYVFDEFGGDGWVTPTNYAGLEADNFAGQAGAGPRDLARDISGYRLDMGWVNREVIRRHHSARRHVAQLVEVLRGPARRGPEVVTAVGEIARLGRVAWDTERRALSLEAELLRLRERTLTAEAEVEASREQVRDASEWRSRAREAEARVASLSAVLETRRARAGPAAGRLLDGLLRR